MTEVTCAIILDGDRVLVTQRSEQMPHPLKWEFPGGKLKEGESPEFCIKREIYEELGIRVAVKQLLPSVKHRYANGTIKLIPFICSMDKGTITLSEHRSFRWIPSGELGSLDWLDADLEVLRLFQQKGSGTAG